MDYKNFPRRDFFRKAAVFSAASYSRVLGANDRIQLGVIGCGDRGRHDLSMFLKDPTVSVAALCDIYDAQINLARSRPPRPGASPSTLSCWNLRRSMPF